MAAVVVSSDGGSGHAVAPAYQLPRRRISYLIPPPPEDQPPPLLALPAPNEVQQAKKGNPNPLIILASEVDARSGIPHDGKAFAGSPASVRSNGAGATARRGSRQQGNPMQRHPEHTLGISALALDTSTIIDSTGNDSKKPAGILYTGGRDALVASWELSLPLKRRDAPSNADRYPQHHEEPRRRRYRPRWAEDPYSSSSSSEGDDNDDDDDARSSSSRGGSSAEDQSSSQQYPYGKSPRLRLDTTFRDSAVSGSPGKPANGLHLDLSASPRQNGRAALRHRSRRSERTIPYEDRWCIDSSALPHEVSHRNFSTVLRRLTLSIDRTNPRHLSDKHTELIQTGSTILFSAI